VLGRLLILLVLGLALLWFLQWFRRTPSQQVANAVRKGLLWGGIGVLLLLTITGRLNLLFAAMAAAVPLIMRGVNMLRMLPAIQQVLRTLGIDSIPGSGSCSGGRGKTSSIRTRFLEMTLDHGSGDMDGLVLEGAFQGSLLSALELDKLLQLLRRCRREDGQSAALLEAYLDRTRGDEWREASTGGGRDTAPPESGPMNREEALAILGLDHGVDDKAVREAHRRLMQRLHPDRGGSDYLAAKINEAKRILLGD